MLVLGQMGQLMDAAAAAGRRLVVGFRRHRRQGDDEFGSRARPVAACFDGAAVGFDDALDQGQADSQAAVAAVERGIDLPEHVEDLPEHVPGNAGPVVANADQRPVALAGGGEPDRPLAAGVFGGVVQQIAHDLRQAGHVPFDPQRLVGKRDGDAVVERIDERLDPFQRPLDQRVDADRLLAELNFSLADPRDVHQVVDQANHLPHLPIHGAAELLHLLAIVFGMGPQRQRVADRGQRIAQLVGQRGQEFGFVPVGFFQPGRLAA